MSNVPGGKEEKVELQDEMIHDIIMWEETFHSFSDVLIVVLPHTQPAARQEELPESGVWSSSESRGCSRVPKEFIRRDHDSQY